MNNLLKLLDCSKDDIINILDLADQLKYEKKHNIPHRHLEGKSLGMSSRRAHVFRLKPACISWAVRRCF